MRPVAVPGIAEGSDAALASRMASEVADANGGDHRCNSGVSVLDFVPCDNKTAHVGYIAIANGARHAISTAERTSLLHAIFG